MAGPLTTIGNNPDFSPDEYSLSNGVNDSGLHMTPEAAEAWEDGPLSQLSGQDPFASGISLLNTHAQALPPDPMMDSLRTIALNWMPKNDTDYQDAKQKAQAASDRLTAMRGHLDNLKGIPWLQAAAGFLGPSRTGRFGESLSNALKGYSDSASDLGKTRANFDLQEANLETQRAFQGEAATLGRFHAGVTAASAVAQLTRANAIYQKALSGGANSDFGKNLMLMGVDVNTPQGRATAQRLFALQHGSPELKLAVASWDPAKGGIFDNPDFITHLQQTTDQTVSKKDADIEQKKAATGEATARTKQIEQNIDQNKGSFGPDAAVAKSLKVPTAPVDVYAGVPENKKTGLFETEKRQYYKMSDDLEKQNNEMNAVAQPYSEIKQILDKGTTTGGIYRAPLIGGALGTVATAVSPNLQRLQQLADQAVPHFRVAGSGSTSNYEDKLFKSAGVSIQNDTQVNKDAVDRFLTIQKIMRMKATALDKYFEANKTTQGFHSFWNQYLADNFADAKGNAKPNLNAPDFHDWAVKKGLVPK